MEEKQQLPTLKKQKRNAKGRFQRQYKINKANGGSGSQSGFIPKGSINPKNRFQIALESEDDIAISSDGSPHQTLHDEVQQQQQPKSFSKFKQQYNGVLKQSNLKSSEDEEMTHQELDDKHSYTSTNKLQVLSSRALSDEIEHEHYPELDEKNQQVQVKAPQNKRKRVFAFFMYMLFSLIIIGICVMIYFLSQQKDEQSEVDKKLAVGQEDNVVQMKYYPGQRYQYRYNSSVIENPESATRRLRRQLSTDFDFTDEDQPETAPNKIFEEYNLEFICRDVNDTSIDFFLVINNSTKTFQNEFCKEGESEDNAACKIFTNGFPGILTAANSDSEEQNQGSGRRNLIKVKKDQKFQNKTNSFSSEQKQSRRVLPEVEDPQIGDFSFGSQAMDARQPSPDYEQVMEDAKQKELEEIQGGQEYEQLVGFFEEEEELREFLNLSLNDYLAVKQISIVEFFIKKTGGISEVIIPYPMPAEIHVMIPKILDTFAPILSKQVYSGEEKQAPVKSAVGDFETQYQLEGEGDDLQMKNSYTKEQGNENGQMGIQQNSESKNKFNKDGQMDSSSQSGSMNISPPGQDNDVDKSGPTNQMMGDIQYDTEFTMQLLFSSEVEKLYLYEVEEYFEKCPQLKMTYEELNDMIVEYELEQMNQEEDLEQGGEGEDESMEENGRRVLVSKGKATMGKQSIQVFSADIMDKEVTADVTFQCFEASDKGKDICEMSLYVMGNPTGLKKTFRANMSKIFKTINWFRIRAVEGISNLVNDIKTDLIGLTETYDGLLENLETFINPETNAFTQPIFLINDFIESITTKLFIGFSEFLQEQIQILKNLIKQPTFNLVQILKKKTEHLFKDLDKVNTLIINSYHRQTKAMLYFIETQPTIYDEDISVLQTLRSEFDRFIQLYSEGPLDSLNDIYTEQAVEPVQKLINTFTLTLEDGGFDMSDMKTKIMGGVFQTILYTHVNAVVIKEAEKQQADLRKNVEFVKKGFQVKKDEIYQLFDSLEQRFNDRKVSGSSNGQLKQNFAVFLKTEPLYSHQLFDIASSSIVNIDDLAITDDVAQSRDFLLSEIQRGMDLFYSYTDDIFYSFKNGVSEIKSSLVDIKSNVKEQFSDTKDSVVTLFQDSKDFLKNAVEGFKNLLKGSNSTDYYTEDQTISFIGIADDITGVIDDIHEGIDAVKASVEKTKELIELAKELPEQFEKVIEGPFKSFNDGELEETDHKQLQKMFNSILSGSFDDAFDAIKTQITDGIGKDVVEKFNEETEEMNNGFGDYIVNDVIGSLASADDLFVDVFNAILTSFSITSGPNTIGEPFVKEKKFSKTFITPVGIPITVEAFASIRLELYWGLNIQMKQIQVYGGAQANCEVGASAAVDALVARAGIEVKGIVFDGKVQVDMELAITNGLEGNIRGTVTILPIYFQFGIFYQIIGIHPSCKKVNRRILDVNEIYQQQLGQGTNLTQGIASPNNFLRKIQKLKQVQKKKIDVSEQEMKLEELAQKIHHHRRKLIFGAIKKLAKSIASSVSKIAKKIYKVAKDGIEIIADNFCLPYLKIEYNEKKYIYTKKWEIWSGVPPKVIFEEGF